ncbi:MaoC family dehydratase [Aureivirga sp. CE67]|uniref:MaoC family dehydratase n=1 Tax=Aureivirga sp. CE67 TaxID=1788983 RepID=UPI0018C9334E|nr:MaoC family dehydratase [Aureivirga sp. CE67]
MEKIPQLLKKIGDKHYVETCSLCYEDFEVGAIIESNHGRTITSADCMWMTMLMGIETAMHINQDYAKKSEFGDVIIEQLVVFSISIGLSSRLISGSASANFEFDELKALHPVRIGDTLYVTSEVLSMRESKSRPKQGIVKLKIITKNQDGVVVHTGTRTMLVWKKEFLPQQSING